MGSGATIFEHDYFEIAAEQGGDVRAALLRL
jgi:hypothetical protein